MDRTIHVLDHGYVKFVEFWGSDERIIEAARMSTQKGFLGWGPKCKACGQNEEETTSVSGIKMQCAQGESHQFDQVGDEKLLRFLYENKHASPFEMAGVMIEVKAPIFVFREWHRHRTQSYNEMSARYEPLPDENYIPSIERLMINAGTANKQAGTVVNADALTLENAECFRRSLARVYDDQQSLYTAALNSGVPKELARVHLPVGRYSRMMASAVLRNWLGFLTLRMDSKAQWEIRQYANAVGELIKVSFPHTWSLFAESRQ